MEEGQDAVGVVYGIEHELIREPLEPHVFRKHELREELLAQLGYLRQVTHVSLDCDQVRVSVEIIWILLDFSGECLDLWK